MKNIFATLLLCVFAQAEIYVSEGERFAKLNLFAKDSLQMEESVQNITTLGFFLNGLAMPNLSFNAYAELSLHKSNKEEYFNTNYEPYLGYPCDILGDDEDRFGQGNAKTCGFFYSRIDWQATQYFKISGGYDYISYGPARHNKLTLRGADFNYKYKRPVPTPFFGFDLNMDFISYSQTIAQLKNDKEQRKLLHAHRLDFRILKNLNLGLSETVVYGERSTEVIYLVPFVPYMLAEGYAGDKDNKAISADISWKAFDKFTIYGELFIDDLYSITSFFDDDWWGNKWAATLGFAIDSAKIGIFNWDYNFEYTRIEPWVYTHHKGMNFDYTHFGNSLGSDLGPNSREIYSNLGISYNHLLRLDLSVSAIAKDTAFGGNIGDIHLDGDPTDKKYLNPKTTKHSQEYGIGILYKPFPIWHIGAKQYFKNENRTEIYSGIVF